MSYNINHVCFSCRLTRRASRKATVRCPRCRQDMTSIGLAQPPKRRDVAAWHSWQALRDQRVQTWGVERNHIELHKNRQHRAFLDVVEYRDGASKAERRKYRRAESRYERLQKARVIPRSGAVPRGG